MSPGHSGRAATGCDGWQRGCGPEGEQDGGWRTTESSGHGGGPGPGRDPGARPLRWKQVDGLQAGVCLVRRLERPPGVTPGEGAQVKLDRVVCGEMPRLLHTKRV